MSEGTMIIEVLADADSVARKAAAIVAAEAQAAVAERGRFVAAVSGGHTPWLMLRALAGERAPWESMHIFQVDERVAPTGHPARNLTGLRESLLEHAPLRPEHVHAMPVESPDLGAAAAQYGLTLRRIAGSPPVLDLVHLGLGPDGHTASLVPGDPVLEISISVRQLRNTASPSDASPARRRCSTSFIWASGPMATLPPWCPEIRSSRSRSRCGSCAIRPHPPTHRRLAAGARPRSSGPRARWPHCLPGARRSGPRDRRRGCCGDRCLPGKASDDVDLSGARSCATRPLAGHRERKSANDRALARRRSV